ncbi:MAG: hypothetical protein ABSE64_02870 [Vulcanimicrobiaceae bacterium]|jgi:hypothetical protein
MKRLIILVCALLIAPVLFLAGCRNSPSQYECTDPNDPSTCSWVVTYTTPTNWCKYPNGKTAPQLIYPIPNATGVPDNLPNLVVADTAGTVYSTPSFSIDYAAVLSTETTRQALLLNGDGLQSWFTSIALNQVPAPSAGPLPNNTEFEAAGSFNGLTAATTYYLYITNNTFNCSDNGPIGSFTTQ